MLLHLLRPGSAFRLPRLNISGKVISRSPCAVTVELEAAGDRSFETAEGEEVTIKGSKRKLTWSRETEVEAL